MKHHHKPAAPAVEVARPQPQPHHHPVGYDIPSHLGKIFRSEAFKQAAHDVGHTAEAFQAHVAEALKKLIADNHAEQLAKFEESFAHKAVARAVEKLKSAQ